MLEKEETIDEFVKAISALLTNAQIVNPKFVINPINPTAMEKDIAVKDNKFPKNMTKLSLHVKISGKANTFSKQKIWDDCNTGRKSSKQKEECRNPTVYFLLMMPSEVDPKEN